MDSLKWSDGRLVEMTAGVLCWHKMKYERYYGALAEAEEAEEVKKGSLCLLGRVSRVTSDEPDVIK